MGQVEKGCPSGMWGIVEMRAELWQVSRFSGREAALYSTGHTSLAGEVREVMGALLQSL